MTIACLDRPRSATTHAVAIAEKALAVASRTVVTCAMHGPQTLNGHEASTRAEIARRLARLAGFEYGGEHDPDADWQIAPYFVPSDTLTSTAAARLGIGGADDLFGGVVPASCIATKAITHPLVDADAVAPLGWSPEFPRLVAGSVLVGYSAFSKKDALRAGRLLLERGDIRVKLGSGIAGMGQWVANSETMLENLLEAVPDEELAATGVVLEENLIDVVTHSVGCVRIAEMTATYCGTQHTTSNNHGADVYGGSELRVVRGGFSALLALDLPVDVRLAIAQARVYDDAADRCFAGFFASRRNYDVAQGTDIQGRRRSGVLEQSWRIGGASGAEIGALEAFRADPSLTTVHARSHEIYGEAPALPDGAAVYFRGIDPHVGELTKFAIVEPYADTR